MVKTLVDDISCYVDSRCRSYVFGVYQKRIYFANLDIHSFFFFVCANTVCIRFNNTYWFCDLANLRCIYSLQKIERRSDTNCTMNFFSNITVALGSGYSYNAEELAAAFNNIVKMKKMMKGPLD